MAKKTTVRRLSKMLPLSSEIIDHVTKDDSQFDGMRNVTRQAPVFALPKAEETKPQALEVSAETSETEEQP